MTKHYFVKLLKIFAKSHACRSLGTITLFVVDVITPVVLVLFVTVRRRRGRAASSLMDQKCNEQTHGVLSAKAFSVFASSMPNTSLAEPFRPRHGHNPI